MSATFSRIAPSETTLVSSSHRIAIDIAKQEMTCFLNDKKVHHFLISSAEKGVGQIKGSFQTPLGRHIIRAKIGEGAPPNTVFVGRRQTGEMYSLDWANALRANGIERDWILTRILWLSGKELGKNRLGNCDTMQRYIYIHGTPDDVQLGVPGSHGCIRMKNSDIIQLFEWVPIYTQVDII